MNTYSLYSLETGLFTGCALSCSLDRLMDEVNVPAGCGVIVGVYDHLSQKVDLATGQVVDYQPPQPSSDHVWDISSRRWVYVPPRSVIEEKVWQKIKAERERRKAGGVRVGDHWFHSDADSRTQYSILDGKAQRAGWSDSQVIHPTWKTMDRAPDGSSIYTAMTVELLRQILDAGIDQEAVTFAIAEKHRVTMQASLDPETYDFSAGWPAIYGEEHETSLV